MTWDQLVAMFGAEMATQVAPLYGVTPGGGNGVTPVPPVTPPVPPPRREYGGNPELYDTAGVYANPDGDTFAYYDAYQAPEGYRFVGAMQSYPADQLETWQHFVGANGQASYYGTRRDQRSPTGATPAQPGGLTYSAQPTSPSPGPGYTWNGYSWIAQGAASPISVPGGGVTPAPPGGNNGLMPGPAPGPPPGPNLYWNGYSWATIGQPPGGNNNGLPGGYGETPGTTALNAGIAAGFINGVPTLARQQFEESQRQFVQQMENIRRTTDAQIQNLIATQQLSRETLEETIRHAQESEHLAQAQFGEAQRQFNVGAMGYDENGRPTLQREGQEFNQNQALAQMMGNPRNVAQSLIALGRTPQEAGSYLGSTPFAAGLMNQSPQAQAAGLLGLGYAGSPARPSAAADAMGFAAPQGAAMALPSENGLAGFGQPAGGNPDFGFINGRQLDARQGLDWLSRSSPNVDLVSSLASFAGQNPNSFWGDFQAALPKGGRNPLSSFL